ncbi:unnamed protein product [Musa acuminata subsp. malaccensis]|uniref:Prohibitin n=1 Tax=Musa acuminata subsp. malaccensis TaxID=214687 RepID=A0A804IF73_MUSAM|nr:unnamed protein product [Musa acuminata subsp. malaccensis]
MIPWFKRPIIYDVRTLLHLVESTSGNRDLQMVTLLFHQFADLDHLQLLLFMIGETKMKLKQFVSSPIHNLIAIHVISSLCCERMAVSQEIQKILTERARNFNIALDDISITSLIFVKELTNAIKLKQVAAQEAECAEFIVEKAEKDKNSAVISMSTNSTFSREKMINNLQFATIAFLALRQIEAADEIAHIIANSSIRIFLQSDDLLLNQL